MKKISLALIPLVFMGASCMNTSTNTNTSTQNENTNTSATENTNTEIEVHFAATASYPETWAQDEEHSNNLFLSLSTNPDNNAGGEFYGPHEARVRVYHLPQSEINPGSYANKLLHGDTSVFEPADEDEDSMGISTTLLSQNDIVVDTFSGKQYFITSATSGNETSDFQVITVLQAPSGIILINAGYGNGDTRDQLKSEILSIVSSLHFTF